MDFNPIIFEVSEHSVDRWAERSGIHYNNRYEAKTGLIEILKQSFILIENKFYRYYKYKEFIFPCGIRKLNGKLYLKCTTVLFNMTINDNENFENAMTKYLEAASN